MSDSIPPFVEEFIPSLVRRRQPQPPRKSIVSRDELASMRFVRHIKQKHVHEPSPQILLTTNRPSRPSTALSDELELTKRAITEAENTGSTEPIDRALEILHSKRSLHRYGGKVTRHKLEQRLMRLSAPIDLDSIRMELRGSKSQYVNFVDSDVTPDVLPYASDAPPTPKAPSSRPSTSRRFDANQLITVTSSLLSLSSDLRPYLQSLRPPQPPNQPSSSRPATSDGRLESEKIRSRILYQHQPLTQRVPLHQFKTPEFITQRLLKGHNTTVTPAAAPDSPRRSIPHQPFHPTLIELFHPNPLRSPLDQRRYQRHTDSFIDIEAEDRDFQRQELHSWRMARETRRVETEAEFEAHRQEQLRKARSQNQQRLAERERRLQAELQAQEAEFAELKAAEEYKAQMAESRRRRRTQRLIEAREQRVGFNKLNRAHHFHFSTQSRSGTSPISSGVTSAELSRDTSLKALSTADDTESSPPQRQRVLRSRSPKRASLQSEVG